MNDQDLKRPDLFYRARSESDGSRYFHPRRAHRHRSQRPTRSDGSRYSDPTSNHGRPIWINGPTSSPSHLNSRRRRSPQSTVAHSPAYPRDGYPVFPPTLQPVQNGVHDKAKLFQGLPETGVRLGELTTVRSGPARTFLDGDKFVGSLLSIPPDEPRVTYSELIRNAPDRMGGSTAAIAW